MANYLLDNTYYVFDSSGSALSWPTGGARIKSLVLYAVSTAANVVMQAQAGTPIFQFNYIQTVAVNSGISMMTSTHLFDFNGVRFQTAWIPTTLTACSAWIHFI